MLQAHAQQQTQQGRNSDAGCCQVGSAHLLAEGCPLALAEAAGQVRLRLLQQLEGRGGVVVLQRAAVVVLDCQRVARGNAKVVGAAGVSVVVHDCGNVGCQQA